MPNIFLLNLHLTIDTREKPGLEMHDITYMQKYGVPSYPLFGTSDIHGCLTKGQEMGTFLLM